MSGHSARNLERSTRNSTKGRSTSAGPHLSTSHSRATPSRDSASPSPSCNETLPAKEKNNNETVREKGLPQKSDPPSEHITKVKQTDELSGNPLPSQPPITCKKLVVNEDVGTVPIDTDVGLSDNIDNGEVGTVSIVTDVGPSGNMDDLPSDRSEVASQTYFHDDTKETLKQVLADLQEIKSTTSKLHNIEEATATFSKDLQNVTKRTTSLESALEASTTRVRELDEEVSTLKEMVRKQERSISSLQRMKEELSKSTDKKMQKMNELMEEQKDQVKSFQSTSDHLKQEIFQVMDSKLEDRSPSNDHITQELIQVINTKIDSKIASKSETDAQEAHYHDLREQAFHNRYNLVVSGLNEDKHKSTIALVKNFLSSTLNITNVDIQSASRLGSTPEEGSSYSRPILIKFAQLPHRNLVWRKRQTITGNNDDEQRIRIHADLPKELREGVQLLYKVAKAAAKMDQFGSAKVTNYQLSLDGQHFLPSQLETLPQAIRPSTLASPRSEHTLTFFTGQSILSNHFPSNFVIEEQEYTSMEHFLAVKKARISERPTMIRKAVNSRDPKQAKYILNALKGDHDELWDKEIHNIALEGLRAKFTQNPSLGEFLLETKNLKLGEASTNMRWGIGMSLDDPDVLDSTKWNPEGNLLGNLLMKVREELRCKSQ